MGRAERSGDGAGFVLIAVALAQLFGGFLWLPLARRWLRGDGRRTASRSRSGHAETTAPDRTGLPSRGRPPGPSLESREPVVLRTGWSSVFGSAARVPRPVLFVLVYGIFLVIVGVTATAQTMLVSSNFSTSTLSSVVGTDAALIRSVVNTYVSPDDTRCRRSDRDRRAALEADLARLVRRAEILRVELRRPDGTIIASDRADVSGLAAAGSPDFRAAAEGQTIAAQIADVERQRGSRACLSRRRACCASTSRSRPTARSRRSSGSGVTRCRSSPSSTGSGRRS